jgi:hypothetical protein
MEPARDERERVSRGVVEPVCVVDEAEDGLLFGGRGENAQRGRRDGQSLRRGTVVDPERRGEGAARCGGISEGGVTGAVAAAAWRTRSRPPTRRRARRYAGAVARRAACSRIVCRCRPYTRGCALAVPKRSSSTSSCFLRRPADQHPPDVTPRRTRIPRRERGRRSTIERTSRKEDGMRSTRIDRCGSRRPRGGAHRDRLLGREPATPTRARSGGAGRLRAGTGRRRLRGYVAHAGRSTLEGPPRVVLAGRDSSRFASRGATQRLAAERRLTG